MRRPGSKRRRILGVVALGLLVFTVVGLREARQDPIVRRVTLVVDALPRGTAPLRLALVSDIHVGNWAMDTGRLNRVVDQINAQAPDAIVLDGDYVNGSFPTSTDFHPELVAAPLSRLKAPMGVFATLGNHEAETRPEVVQRELERAHIRVLVNEAARIGPIALVGLDDRNLWRPNMNKAFADAARKGGVPITAVHSPGILPILPDSTPLALIGHTHCGQIVLPGWDNSFDPVNWRPRFNPRYRCGLVHDWHRTVITTAGVGAATFPPLRIGAPPDFWIITLIPRG